MVAKLLAPRDAGALFQVSQKLARVKRDYFAAATEEYALGTKNIMESHQLSVNSPNMYHFCFKLKLYGLDNGIDERKMRFDIIPMRWVVEAFIVYTEKLLAGCKVTKEFWNSPVSDEIRTLLVAHDMIEFEKVVFQNRIMCLEVVQSNALLIEHCRFQTPEVRSYVLGRYPDLIRYFNEPTDNDFNTVLEKEAASGRHSCKWFKELKVQPNWVSERVLSEARSELKYVRTQTYELCMVAVRALMQGVHRLTLGNLFSNDIWNHIRDREMRERIEYEVCQELLEAKRQKK